MCKQVSKKGPDQDFLHEFRTLSVLPDHPNVLSIVGMCYDFDINKIGVKKEFEVETNSAFVTDYQVHGSLHAFIEEFHGRK